ncbi:integrase domain-containing protein [Paraburkholderia nemoris]|uniref:integrase domain-containing protein n=1 Tax=Paraburkholderia nemoris TaxID=2793076 RepID=UPI0038B9EE89
MRKGTKRAQTVSEIQELLARARRTDIGLIHLISLALHLGLRRNEALMLPTRSANVA